MGGRAVLASLITLVLGGGVMYWYDRYHPEVEVFCYEKSSSIPSTSGMPFNTYSSIGVVNPSYRVRATNLAVQIRVPTGRPVQLGRLETAEPERDIARNVTQPTSAEGEAVIIVRAPRLAPHSSLAIPIWWRASGSSKIAVQGTADQCVLRQVEVIPERSIELVRAKRRMAQIGAWLLGSLLAVSLLWKYIDPVKAWLFSEDEEVHTENSDPPPSGRDSA